MTALADRLACADLVHKYALAVRRDRPEDLPALFAPGGWFEIRDGHPSRGAGEVRRRLETPEALLAYLTEGKGRPHPVPLIHNLLVEVTGDTASASSVMEAQVFGTEHRVFGEYADTFRRVGGEWKFASRTFTIFGGVNGEWRLPNGGEGENMAG
jgi:SnoaL-like domain